MRQAGLGVIVASALGCAVACRAEKTASRGEPNDAGPRVAIDTGETVPAWSGDGGTPAEGGRTLQPDAAVRDARAHAACDPQIEQLVEQLASKNPVPEDDDGWGCLPQGYDVAEQQRIRTVQIEILRFGLRAVPTLLAHLDDDRYSRSQTIAAMRPVSVGMACEDLILHLVWCSSCWGCDFSVDWASYFGLAVDRWDLAGWWSRNRHKSVRVLRIQAVKWAMLQHRCDDAWMQAELSALKSGKPVLPVEEFERSNNDSALSQHTGRCGDPPYVPRTGRP